MKILIKLLSLLYGFQNTKNVLQWFYEVIWKQILKSCYEAEDKQFWRRINTIIVTPRLPNSLQTLLGALNENVETKPLRLFNVSFEEYWSYNNKVHVKT